MPKSSPVLQKTYPYPSYQDVTLIVPTLNEERNIAKLLELVTTAYRGIHVIVADDGSGDGTVKNVLSYSRKNKSVQLLDRSKEAIHGLSASVIESAKRTQTSFAVVIDGDLQHPPETIEQIVGKLKEGSDLVIGSRQQVLGNWPIERKIKSKVATMLAKLCLQLRAGGQRRVVADPLSGFFGIRTELFLRILAKREARFEKEGYKILFDLLKYLPKEASLAEVPYDFGGRMHGESKISTKHTLSFLKSLLRP